MSLIPVCAAACGIVLLLAGLGAQQPPVGSAPASPAAADGTWSEGFGRAKSYRSALAFALEEAVAKVKGVGVARGAAVRSRLAVVAEHRDGEDAHEWVQMQIAGFVLSYEVLEKQQTQDGEWEVKVRALIASQAGLDATVVVDLQDGDLRSWQLERFDEDAPGAAVGRERGEFAGPKIADYLRQSRVVQIAARGQGVAVTDGSAPREREKAGRQVVASHRVVLAWQPVAVQAAIERTNPARRTTGPRPEYLVGGSVQVSVQVEDLIANLELFDQTLTISADAKPVPVERLADYVNALVDKAKAIVAENVYFALRPPLVTRVWQDAGAGEWRLEASIARRIAAQFPGFVVGNHGSLTAPDWVPLGRAVLLDGSDTACTFRLESADDPKRIEPNFTEVRPIKD
jgi:hypothetical protein